MNWDSLLPILLLLSSLLPGLIIFTLREEFHALRTVINLSGAVVKLVLVGVMLWGVYNEHVYAANLPFLPGLELTFRADPLPIIFALLIGGFGVKAALVPLHGWLPQAMVAPAPVSALLHAVAVVKAGAFGIVRVVSDVYGLEFARELKLLTPLAIVASVTILYGSLRALLQDDLKKRLAYSTVSQVSYIVLGVAMGTPLAVIGGVVHLVHQGLMKITLFLCAGNLAERLKIHRVSEMDGVGRQMPWTMTAFTLGALGMIGVPPMAGFVTKWYLAMGAWEASQPWVIGVLVASSLLNSAYFLPILYAAWFRPGQRQWIEPNESEPMEVGLWLLVPPVITAVVALAVGLLAGVDVSPLAWAEIIARRELNL